MKRYKNLLLLTAAILTVFIFIVFWTFSSKAYYPELPFEAGSKKEVVEKLEATHNDLVELSNAHGFYWLGFKGNHKQGKDKVIKLMEDRGLRYAFYEGSGIFFENGEMVVITGVQWTSKYILYKVPEERKDASTL